LTVIAVVAVVGHASADDTEQEKAENTSHGISSRRIDSGSVS
jgi:hypothetical protein